MLIMVTDGIGSHFTEAVLDMREPQRLAERIQRGYAKTTDDSLVLVARCAPADSRP
jgi:hypothetical protein